MSEDIRMIKTMTHNGERFSIRAESGYSSLVTHLYVSGGAGEYYGGRVTGHAQNEVGADDRRRYYVRIGDLAVRGGQTFILKEFSGEDDINGSPVWFSSERDALAALLEILAPA